MNRLSSLAVVLVSTLAAAQQARFDDVVDQLDRVSIRARRAGGACRASVMDRVVDLADRLDAQRGRARGLPRVLDELSDLHALATARGCPDDVLDGLLVTMDVLNDVRATSWSSERRDDDFAVARLARLQVTVDPQQARLSVPELTLRGLKSATFNLVLRVRAADGPWSELERTQRWSVPSDPFVWQSAWTFTVPRQKLAALDTSGGRFIARVSVLDEQRAGSSGTARRTCRWAHHLRPRSRWRKTAARASTSAAAWPAEACSPSIARRSPPRSPPSSPRRTRRSA